MQFDAFADDWRKMRALPWDSLVAEILPFFNRESPHSGKPLTLPPERWLDLGGGAGRNTPFFREFCCSLINLDEARQMLLRDTSGSIRIQASMPALPFRAAVFDAVMCIAAIHHVDTSAARIATVRECVRILRPHGTWCCTVWRFFQPRFRRMFHAQFRRCPPGPENASHHELGDVTVPWTRRVRAPMDPHGDSNPRFYHLFRATEFRQLMTPFVCLIRKSFGKGRKKENFLFLGKKNIKSDGPTANN